MDNKGNMRNLTTLLFLILQLIHGTRSGHGLSLIPIRLMSTALFAAKQTKTKRATRNSVGNRTKSSSGFGGAAIEACPCGSSQGYMKCCGKIHNDPKSYGQATPEQVVRARYSAYAKRHIDFIIGSTHPLNKDFMTDIQHWKDTITNNCYDNFELKKCEILEESYEGEGDEQIANVKFIASSKLLHNYISFTIIIQCKIEFSHTIQS
jgi:Uncharacterized protein conserved in bacteria